MGSSLVINYVDLLSVLFGSTKPTCVRPKHSVASIDLKATTFLNIIGVWLSAQRREMIPRLKEPSPHAATYPRVRP